MKLENWDYYHLQSKCIERDSNDMKIRNNRLISNEDIDKNCTDLLFIPIYNTSPGFPEWFKNMNEEDLLKNNSLFSKLVKKALQ